MNFFSETMEILNQPNNHLIISIVFMALVGITVLLRIVAHVHFRASLLAFQIESRKEIKNRAEIKNIKNGLLQKVCAEYIRVAERAVTAVPTKDLTDRAIAGMSLLGWKYENIIPFVESMETGLLWVGIILAIVFTEYAFVYGAFAVVAFLITHIFAAFFNARSARTQLSTEIMLYVEREIGRFFAADSSGAILRLKNDLTDAINNQSKIYKDTMDNIAKTMSTTMNEVSATMIAAAKSIGPIVATAMDEKLINMNATLSATLDKWEDSLQEATDVHTKINDSAERLSTSSALLATHLQGHSNALSDHLLALVKAVDATKEGLDNLALQQQALTKQASYIEANQHTLDTTLHSYEESLQKLTQSIGDGLGTFIDIHAQSSAQAVNDALKSNIDRIIQLSTQK